MSEALLTLILIFVVILISGGCLIYLFLKANGQTKKANGLKDLERIIPEKTLVGDALRVCNYFDEKMVKVKPDVSGISSERVLEILAEHDSIPTEKRKKIDYAIFLFTIVLENEGVDFTNWQTHYCDSSIILEAFKKADICIRDALIVSGKSTFDKMFPHGEEYKLHSSFIELYSLV